MERWERSGIKVYGKWKNLWKLKIHKVFLFLLGLNFRQIPDVAWPTLNDSYI